MYNIPSLFFSNHSKLLKATNKAITTYLFAFTLADDNEQSNAILYGYNPYHLYQLMSNHGIEISQKQVYSSIEQLQQLGLIKLHKTQYNAFIEQYQNFSIEFLDTRIAYWNKKNAEQKKADHESITGETMHITYLKMHKYFISNAFNKLSVRQKRLVLYLYFRLSACGDIKLNIKKKQTYKELCKLLKVTRRSKIRDTFTIINEQNIFSIILLNDKYGNETYKIKKAEKLSSKGIITKSNPFIISIEPSENKKKVIDNIAATEEYSFSHNELNIIYKYIFNWNTKKIRYIIEQYINTVRTKTIKKIDGWLFYFRTIAV